VSSSNTLPSSSLHVSWIDAREKKSIEPENEKWQFFCCFAVLTSDESRRRHRPPQHEILAPLESPHIALRFWFLLLSFLCSVDIAIFTQKSIQKTVLQFPLFVVFSRARLPTTIAVATVRQNHPNQLISNLGISSMLNLSKDLPRNT
jgi:hypothetical protein